MKKIIVITALTIVIITTGISLTAQNHDNMSKSELTNSKAYYLKTNMRKLWEDHVVWTRNVILGIVNELPGYDEAVKRLLENQDEIGNSIKPYYGEVAGNKLAELLRIHVNISADVVKAANTFNIKGLDESNKLWIANADEISAFLSKINIHWKPEEMKQMMRDHLLLTTAEALARIKRDYKADVIAYDAVHNDILEMADMLSDGIIKQFPDMFN